MDHLPRQAAFSWKQAASSAWARAMAGRSSSLLPASSARRTQAAVAAWLPRHILNACSTYKA